MAVELKPLVLESTLTMQKILEAEDHTARLILVRHFVEAETKRLQTKKALQGMFSGSGGILQDSAIPPEEMVTDELDDAPSRPSSFFADEEDAFQ